LARLAPLKVGSRHCHLIQIMMNIALSVRLEGSPYFAHGSQLEMGVTAALVPQPPSELAVK
jgi:hypothetical protein